jgi:hypothetical protein
MGAVLAFGKVGTFGHEIDQKRFTNNGKKTIEQYQARDTMQGIQVLVQLLHFSLLGN